MFAGGLAPSQPREIEIDFQILALPAADGGQTGPLKDGGTPPAPDWLVLQGFSRTTQPTP